MRREGISVLATSVVLLVLGVALALIVYSVVTGSIFGIYQKQQAGIPGTNIEIVNFNPGNETLGQNANVTIRNMGPNSLPIEGEDHWQVFIDDEQYEVVALSPDSGELEVGGVLVIYLGEAVSWEPHTIKVYGPLATRAFAGWSPGG
mgnify:CR=1 FL=1